ncbi:MAG: PPK2 family polyphosphate kinase [Actinomycetota bacterium]
MEHVVKIDGSKKVRLADLDPGYTNGLEKAEAKPRTDIFGQELAELADLLYYAGEHSLLIVLQGRDTSGKDGTIRRILNYTNAQSLRVESFKAPTADELAHDFLWRVHARTPGRGHATIFNRSHYEDVLVVRVHDLVPKDVWKRRYNHINHFEKLLTDSRTILLKFFLNISMEEQEERLHDREKETEKAWKLSVGDWKERERWDDYTAAYEDAINKCAFPTAPWIIVPADHKWYRDLVIVEQIVETLRPYREQWLASLEETGRTALQELEAYRAEIGDKARSG